MLAHGVAFEHDAIAVVDEPIEDSIGDGAIAKILDGAKAGDLPIERSTKFEFVFNLKTAKGPKLNVPDTALLRTDEILQ